MGRSHKLLNPDQEVVEATLEVVATSFTSPAVIAFDYATNEAVDVMKIKMKAIGEAWVFGMTPEEMVQLVVSKALSIFDHISTEDGRKRYFPTRATDGKYVTVGSDLPCLMLAGNHMMTPPA